MAVLLAIGVVAGWVARQKNADAVKSIKTAMVAAEFSAASGRAELLLDSDGIVIRSNSAADILFAMGHNIEGSNVHDFCVDKITREKAIQGLKRWTASARAGEQLIVYVTANLPQGHSGLTIVATAVRREPGSNVAVTAMVSLSKDVTIKDLR